MQQSKIESQSACLTFPLAQSDDFDEVVKLSKEIRNGHDYLPLKFYEWLKRENLDIFLAYSGDKLVGLRASFVVDEGKTFITRAGRVLPELQGHGVSRELTEFIRKYLRERFPSVQRQRFTTRYDNIGSATRLLELDILSYEVKNESFAKATEISTPANSAELKQCSKQYLSDVVFSRPVADKLFPSNIVVVNWCPFSPIRSNIEYILQETDNIFVEKCAYDVLPKSLSFGTFSPRLKYLQCLVFVYTNDPNLFEAHLLCHFKRTCDVIKGDFVFMSFQDKSLAPLGRKVMDKLQTQQTMSVCHLYHNQTMKVYGKD